MFMKFIKQYCCALVTMVCLPPAALSAVETPGQADQVVETFEVLQTKTDRYENVTVTSKNKDWILIVHDAGMGNVKVSDLPDDAQIKLGYKVAKAEPMRLSLPKIEALAGLKLPEVEQLRQSWREGGVEAVMKTLGDPRTVWSVIGIAVLLHLLFSYCSMLICRKAHTSPGFLVWLPVLQLIPLLRAAGMSGMWFFVPVINLVVWYVNIARARDKGPFLVVCLLLPLTTPFAFLYLALSEATPIRLERRVPLALETA
jgi:hypothetical protein